MINVSDLSLKQSVLNTAAELRAFKGIEDEDYRFGERSINIYADPNFNISRAAVREKILQLLTVAIDDLVRGGLYLRAGSLGVHFHEGKYRVFDTPYSTPAVGLAVFTISLKKLAAFQSWRERDQDDIDQDELNRVVYFLIVLLSRYI